MNIRVGKYILRSDPYCLWIEEEYRQKDGKAASKRVAGYSWNLSNLLRSFAEKKLYGSDAENMEQLIADIREILADMVKLNEAAVEHKLKTMNEHGGNDAESKGSEGNR